MHKKTDKFYLSVFLFEKSGDYNVEVRLKTIGTTLHL